MEKNLLNDKDWQKLLKIFEQGQCVLMLGSDIPSGSDNSQPPLTTLFARYLAAQIDSDTKIFDPDDMTYVVQHYLAKRIGDRLDLELEAVNFYAHYREGTTKLHRALAQLPFSYCVSTTPDVYMVNAFKEVDKHPIKAYYNFGGGNQTLPATPTPNTPLVYQLYGSTDNSESLVLSETDLLDFLANIIAGQPELPSALGKVFGDKKTSFLFIGFGFQRWYLRVLLHLFHSTSKNARTWSIALENNRFFSDPALEQTTLFYGDAHSIEFKNCPWSEFADDLLKLYRQKTDLPVATVEPNLPDDAPTVFLCHCSQDSEAVADLGKKLRDKGLNPWRDRDDLRGGENWDRRIKHLIDTDAINYFLVVQTPAMLAQSESYFVKEINLALERQTKNVDGFIFIIPILLSGSSETKLEALHHLNYLDLRQDLELDRLVRDIFDDRQRRLVRKEAANG